MRVTRLTCACAGLALVFLPLAPVTAAAQAGESPVQFDIASQPLAPALQALAREGGIEILFDQTLLGARQVAGLHGKMTVTQALVRLLTGSNLTARHTAGGAYVIVRTTGRGAHATQTPGPTPVANPGPSPPQDPPLIAEVLVIGRRSLDADISRSADDIQPYQVSTQADIGRSQTVSVEDFFRSRLPADAQSIALVQAPALNSASTQSRIDLHGLGAAQTLVLVDGRRMPSAPAIDDFLQPNLNGIPLLAIDRIETLTSSAGGIYGPGAMGGVINVVLRRDLNGAELSATSGVTAKGDGLHWRLDGLAGGSFFDGRARVMLALSADNNDGLTQGSRDYTEAVRVRVLQLSPQLVLPTPVSNSLLVDTQNGSRLRFTAANGGTRLSSSHDAIPFDTEGGAAVIAALKANAGAAPDPTLSPDGGGQLASLVTTTRTRSAVFSLRQEITPDLEVFLDSLYLYSLGTAAGPKFTATVEIARGQFGNPFSQAVSVSFPAPGFAAKTINHEITSRETLGAIRRLGQGWTAEADLTAGRATENIRSPVAVDLNSRVNALDPTAANLFTGGQAIVALLSGLKSPGDNRASQADDLTDLNLRVAGPAAHLPGGPLSITLLGEWRRDANPGEVFKPFGGQASRVGSQRQTVSSLYGEARAPLISPDVPGLLSGLELQLALRGDAYAITVPRQNPQTNAIGLIPVSARHQTFAVTTGLRAFPAPGLEVRTSFATSYLPPAPSQIVPATFETPQQTPSYFPADPRRGGQPLGSEGPFFTAFNGSPSLGPEKAASLSAGLIFTPVWAKGLRLSVDYTRINRSQEIREPDPGDEYTWLLTHEADFPARVTRAPLTAADMAKGYTGGVITAVDFSPINMGRSAIDAVDINLAYQHPTPFGAATVYGQTTWTPRFERRDDPYEQAFNTVGHIDGPLPWRGNLGVQLANGAWTVELNAQLLGPYRVTYGATDFLSVQESRANVLLQGGDKAAGQAYLDALVTFTSSVSRTQIRLGVRNLLDKRPPLVLIPQVPLLLNTGQPYYEGIGYSSYGDARGRRFELNISKRY